MSKDFHNGINITAKHDTIFLREEILEFFMVPTIKTHLSVWHRRFQPFNLERKVEILETYLNSASKNTSETDIFPHGTKSLLTSVINDLLTVRLLHSFLTDPVGHSTVIHALLCILSFLISSFKTFHIQTYDLHQLFFFMQS